MCDERKQTMMEILISIVAVLLIIVPIAMVVRFLMKGGKGTTKKTGLFTPTTVDIIQPAESSISDGIRAGMLDLPTAERAAFAPPIM